MEQTVKARERKLDYRKFGLNYVPGRKVCHLQGEERTNTQCGLHRLELRVKCGGATFPVCKNCKKTVKIIKELGKRIAVFRGINGVMSVVENPYWRDEWQS